MFAEFINAFWAIMLELSPYLILGLIIAGLLHTVVKPSQIEKQLGGKGIAPVLKAVLLGVPLPLCSCGVIPTGVAFKKHGASEGATVSFLISTPQTGVDSILVTYTMLGPIWAIIRPLIALFTGIAGGLAASTYSYDGASQMTQIQNEEEKGSWIKRFVQYAFHDFLIDISRPLITGIFLAVLLTLAVPDSLFAEHLSSPVLNMLIILVISVPLYVCATGSVPVAAALLAKGLSPGAALVFLMAGPATNTATFTVLWNTLGKQMTLTYVATIVIFSLAFGLAIDYAFPASWFSILPGRSQQHSHLIPEGISALSAILLIALLAFVEIKRLLPKREIQMSETGDTYLIEGMTCNHCKANVERALSELSKVEKVEVELDSGSATVEGSVTADEVKAAVESIGYKFKGQVSTG